MIPPTAQRGIEAAPARGRCAAQAIYIADPGAVATLIKEAAQATLGRA